MPALSQRGMERGLLSLELFLRNTTLSAPALSTHLFLIGFPVDLLHLPAAILAAATRGLAVSGGETAASPNHTEHRQEVS